jgi:hypothetical protein
MTSSAHMDSDTARIRSAIGMRATPATTLSTTPTGGGVIKTSKMRGTNVGLSTKKQNHLLFQYHLAEGQEPELNLLHVAREFAAKPGELPRNVPGLRASPIPP